MFAFNGGVYSFGACLLSDFQLVDPSSYVIDAQTDSSVYSVMASVAEIMYFNFRNCMDITTVQIWFPFYFMQNNAVLSEPDGPLGCIDLHFGSAQLDNWLYCETTDMEP